jgi:hypothetical protein
MASIQPPPISGEISYKGPAAGVSAIDKLQAAMRGMRVAFKPSNVWSFVENDKTTNPFFVTSPKKQIR